MSLTLQLPVRIDFLGGWTDQECWEGPGAVLNAAVGWEGKYPLSLNADGEWSSLVSGEGTGLGISSIRHAGDWLMGQREYHQNHLDPCRRNADVFRWATCAAVEAEKGSTQGGWQDAAGALRGGIKVVGGEYPRISALEIPYQFPGGGLFDTVVLFDTGIRRDSALIGEKVRYLIQKGDDKLRRLLKGAAENAPRLLFATDLREAALLCVGVWGLLCESVPEMECRSWEAGLKFSSSRVWGYKLLGAGGGGYGVMFCEPEARAEVRDTLRARGLWATIPELLPGPRWVMEEGASDA